MEELSRTLKAGALLIHNDKGAAPNLTAVLLSRLSGFRASLGLPEQDTSNWSLEQAQHETAEKALYVVERVQEILDDGGHGTTDEAAKATADKPTNEPAIGTRDISQLRTLLSIIFKWGTEPLLGRVQSAWPTKPISRSHHGPKFVDLTSTPEDYRALALVSKRIFALLLPRGVHGNLPRTLITTAILNRHITDLLRPGIALGWVPKTLSTKATPVVDELRPLVMRLLSILPPSQTIASLGAILANASTIPTHVQKSCSSLLSRQLLRPDGVRGLCAAVFGEGEGAGDDAPLEKLTHVARVLSAAPAIVPPEEYYGTVVPVLIHFISPGADVPPSYIRAAAFTLSRMIVTDGSSPNHALVSGILRSNLHDPFLRVAEDATTGTTAAPPATALQTLQIFLTNTDPSPTLISSLLSPIASSLYSLLSSLERLKTVDPALKEGVRGLLLTWGRVIPAEEGIAVLWACVEDQGGDWAADIAGTIRREARPQAPSSLALFTPEDLKRAEENGELDADANILGLRPDPVHFVLFLKALDRADMSSELFVRLLEGYRDMKSDRDGDPTRTLLFLQLVIQMQTQLAGEDASSNILSKPEHILSFVKHALESGTTPAERTQDNKRKRSAVPRVKGLTLDDLRIVGDVAEEENIDTGADSDDETPGLEGVPPDDEMTATAINLLLSILEANPDLSTRSTPILGDILTHIEQLTKHPSDILRPLAREARMVLTVRLASTSSSSASKSKQPDDTAARVQETYQKSLKLLQDPILPVRAHGLLLLRELVSPPRNAPPGTAEATARAVRPLVPAVLDIFMQSIQDDDSYIFLNAVQGLSALVDGFGGDVLRSLVRAYADGLDGIAGTAMTQRDVDVRIRVGEALGQVIKRCGGALSLYSSMLVPPLFALVRITHLPTTIRTSALSLLAQCADASDLALLPYAADLSNAMLDLLQIESVRSAAPEPQQQPAVAPEPVALDSKTKRRRPTVHDGSSDTEEEESAPPGPPPSMDTQPTVSDAKFPPLRRAALHFLALLVRAYTVRAYSGDASDSALVLEFPVRRAKVTLGYVSATDADGLVRVMAQEVVDAVQALEKALSGE